MSLGGWVGGTPGAPMQHKALLMRRLAWGAREKQLPTTLALPSPNQPIPSRDPPTSGGSLSRCCSFCATADDKGAAVGDLRAALPAACCRCAIALPLLSPRLSHRDTVCQTVMR